ncbi:hypothetical protein [Desulfosporosinus sp. I2]|uniref:phosphotriesterase family protein n=1 Tax=Desulfosporosinus sp. I2 TaxID=1617025 RepID=UPI001FA73484|nr:hypothetical protein [Desulfosporosinus sp. I2]
MLLSNPAIKRKRDVYYTQELVEFKKVGGKSLVDDTPMGGHVNMKKLCKLSEDSGVNIIACTGFYLESVIPKKLVKGGENAMIEALSIEIERGIGQSGVKPGFVKCAISKVREGRVSEIEMMSMRACARTSKKYGMSLHIHTAYPLTYEMILSVADLLTDEIGIKPERVLMCHIDALSIRFMNPILEVNEKGYNLSLALELLKRGFNIDFDGWGYAIMGKEIGLAQDEARFQLLKELVEAGYAGQICLGHDVVNKMSGKQAGAYGYTRFPTFVPQRMKEEEMNEAAYHQMTVENPARILAY